MALSETTKRHQAGRIIILLISLLLPCIYVEPAFSELENTEAEILSSEVPETAQAEESETHTTASVQSGYRFITPDGQIAAASPYGRQKSGVVGGFSAARLGSDLKLAVDGTFLHEDDYHSELFFDYAGLARFHAEIGTLWHNLLREKVNPGSLITLHDTDPGHTYGIRIATTQVDTRIKLGNNPFHLNLGYWEQNKSGYEQLIFSDHYFGATSNSIISETSRVDRTTREGTFGLDGHLGPIDISYGFRIRDFSNNAGDLRATYLNSLNNAVIIQPQPQAHDVISDSRVTAHTIKLFSDLSGGLVGSAAYSLIQRENNGGHGDAVPSSAASDTIHAVAGNLSYTPFKELSLVLKYRHQEINRETPSTFTYPVSVSGDLVVRPASDSMRDTLTLTTTLRPLPKMIYRLEYQAELESRSNVWDSMTATNPAAVHSDTRQTHTGKATMLWNPFKELKLNATYSYAVSDNPYYGTSFSDRHTGKLLATYTHSGVWGATASYLVKYESGESHAATVLPATVAGYVLPRTNRNDSANVSAWFSPLQRLTITGSYSYLNATTDQTMLLSNLIANPAPLVTGNYRSSAHVYGIDATYAVAEPLDISLALQQVRSKARFDLPIRSFTIAGVAGSFDTSGISDLSRIDSTETGVSARMDWRINALLGCMLEYGYRQFDSGNSSIDGSVHTTMIQLKARW